MYEDSIEIHLGYREDACILLLWHAPEFDCTETRNG